MGAVWADFLTGLISCCVLCSVSSRFRSAATKAWCSPSGCPTAHRLLQSRRLSAFCLVLFRDGVGDNCSDHNIQSEGDEEVNDLTNFTRQGGGALTGFGAEASDRALNERKRDYAHHYLRYSKWSRTKEQKHEPRHRTTNAVVEATGCGIENVFLVMSGGDAGIQLFARMPESTRSRITSQDPTGLDLSRARAA